MINTKKREKKYIGKANFFEVVDDVQLVNHKYLIVDFPKKKLFQFRHADLNSQPKIWGIKMNRAINVGVAEKLGKYSDAIQTNSGAR